MGKITILDGDPGIGKSTMTLAWASYVTQGSQFPLSMVRGVSDRRSRDYRAVREPSSVILVGVEDDAADTVRPRLDAAGADAARVHQMVQELDDKGLPVPFVIPDDVHVLRDAINECGARLVVVDPIAAFISDSVKDGSDKSNRKALMALAQVAAETGAAIVLVRHLNKAAGMSAKNRGGGSVAYTALARSVLVAGKLPPGDDDPAEAEVGPRFVLAKTKGNVAVDPDSHAYTLRESDSNPDIAVIHWQGSVAISADQVVGAEGAVDSRKRAPERDEAARVLRELLADGPMSSKEAVKQVREETGVSEKTVHAAKKKLGVESKRVLSEDGKLDRWEWFLPAGFRP